MGLTDTADRLIVRGGLTVPVVLALIGAAALAGAFVTGATQETAEPAEPVRPDPQPVNVQRVTGSVQTSAVVTNATALYDEGERLRDVPVYFYDSTPNVTFHVRTNVTGEGASPATLRTELTLVTLGTREGRVFFSDRETLAVGERRIDRGPAWVNTTVNASAIRRTVRERREAVGVAGQLDTTLRLNVSYRTDEYRGNLTAQAPFAVAGRSYRVDGPLNVSTTEQQLPETTPTAIPASEPPEGGGGFSFTSTVLGLLAVGLGALGLAAAVGARYRRLDHHAIRAEIARSRYDEWISRGEIPTKSEKEYIRTDTLEDLVDVAIDSGKRVIHDVELDAYAVVEGDLVYYYSPTEADVTDWFDL